MSHPVRTDNTPRGRRIIQIVSDLKRGSFEGSRVLDIGCAHGAFASEFAKRGATALGVEGRSSWIEIANRIKAENKIENVTFQQGDARDIAVEGLGTFDIVLCLGFLYHLDAPDVFNFLQKLYDITTDIVVIDTHIALTPEVMVHWRGRGYSGVKYREHNAGDSLEAKAASLGSSLDDEFSFWLTRSSLLNALSQVGFSSVVEVKNPISHITEDGVFKINPDVVTYVCFKGTSVGSFIDSSDLAQQPSADWPEEGSQHFTKRPWSA